MEDSSQNDKEPADNFETAAQTEKISNDTLSSPAENTEEQPVREITQTDHLNKRLLSAFLDRINQDVEKERNPDGPEETDDIEWEGEQDDQPGHWFVKK